MKNSTQTTLPHFNFSVTAELKDVTSRLRILINEEINEANWMVSNSVNLDRRTKQHTQFGVSASNGSRDMARTKSWRKKRKKINNEANWMVSNSAKLGRRTKQYTQFGVSASNGSIDRARKKSWRKKKNNEANWMVSNSAKLDSTLNLESLRVTVSEIWPGQNRGGGGGNERDQSHIASPMEIANNK